MRVVAYTRVSTREQAEDGHGLDAQRTAIEGECARRGWQLVDLCTDEGLSGASLKGRNELVRAVRMVESGEADAIMATKIDRVSRCVADFADLIAVRTSTGGRSSSWTSAWTSRRPQGSSSRTS